MSQTRRDFLTIASGCTVVLSSSKLPLPEPQVPGRAEGGMSNGQQREFTSVMAIAAHPGDAFFAMGAPVTVATRGGGQGCLSNFKRAVALMSAEDQRVLRVPTA